MSRLLFSIVFLSIIASIWAHDILATPQVVCTQGSGWQVTWSLVNDYGLTATLTLSVATNLGPVGTVLHFAPNGQSGDTINGVITGVGVRDIGGVATWSDGYSINPWSKRYTGTPPSNCAPTTTQAAAQAASTAQAAAQAASTTQAAATMANLVSTTQSETGLGATGSATSSTTSSAAGGSTSNSGQSTGQQTSASQSTGSQSTQQSTGSQSTGSQDTGSQSTGSQSTGSQSTGAQSTGTHSAAATGGNKNGNGNGQANTGSNGKGHGLSKGATAGVVAGAGVAAAGAVAAAVYMFKKFGGGGIGANGAHNANQGMSSDNPLFTPLLQVQSSPIYDV